MPKYDAKGDIITYTVNEKDVENFVQTSNTNNTIVNTLPSITIEKKVMSISEKDEDGNIVTIDTSNMSEDEILVKPGTVVQYLLKVTNGKVNLQDIEVLDEMANEKTVYGTYNFETGKLSNPISDGVVTTIDELEANETIDENSDNAIYVYYEVDAEDTADKAEVSKINNIASITGKYTDNADNENTVTDNDDANVTVDDDYSTSVEKSQKVDDKEVSKDGKNVEVTVGSEITYTIVVTNDGNVTQKDIKVSDVMTLNGKERADLKISKVDVDKEYEIDSTTGDIIIKSLSAKESATITATYTVQESDMAEDENNTIKNKVTVNGESDEVTVKTEEYRTDIDVKKKGFLSDGTDITGKKDVKVIYGDKIKYSIDISNSESKPGDVKVWDTILKDMKDDVELDGQIKLIEQKSGKTVETITAAQLENGYIVKDVTKGTDLSIVFTVRVTGYAGTVINNIAKFDKTPETDDDKPEKTDSVDAEIEDTGYIVSTVTTTTKVPRKTILVLDYSGSMLEDVNGNSTNNNSKRKIAYLRTAVNNFLDSYFKSNPDNEVMVIAYGDDAYPLTSTTKTRTVTKTRREYNWETGRWETVEYEEEEEYEVPIYVKSKEAATKNLNTTPDGGTNMVHGLRLALENISSADAANTSVILMTDGVAGYKYNEEKDEYEAVYDKNGHCGWTYVDEAGDSTKEAATEIKNKGARLFTIGFGLKDSDAKKMLKDCATPDTDTTKYYYETSDGDQLAKAFDAIANSVTTDNKPEEVETDDGIITISEGFKAGQNVQIFKGEYDSSNPPAVSTAIENLTWTQFINMEYTTYKDGTIEFEFGRYMKDKKLDADEILTFRFVDAKN